MSSGAAILLGFAAILWMLVCFRVIAHKAGFSGWWTLAMIVPFANVLMVWIFAFSDWPRLSTRATNSRASTPRSAPDRSGAHQDKDVPAAFEAADNSIAKSMALPIPAVMKNNRDAPNKTAYTPIAEDAVYATIARELESDETDKGLWTRLFAELDGDERALKVAYIKSRAAKLLALERARLAKIDEAESYSRTKQRGLEALKLQDELESRLRSLVATPENYDKLIRIISISKEVNRLSSARCIELLQCFGADVVREQRFLQDDTISATHLGITRQFGSVGELVFWVMDILMPKIEAGRLNGSMFSDEE